MLQALPYPLPCHSAYCCTAVQQFLRRTLTHLAVLLSLGVRSGVGLLRVDARVVPSVGGPVGPAGGGVILPHVGGPTGLGTLLVDHFFALTDTRHVRGCFVSHVMPPFLPRLARDV